MLAAGWRKTGSSLRSFVHYLMGISLSRRAYCSFEGIGCTVGSAEIDASELDWRKWIKAF